MRSAPGWRRFQIRFACSVLLACAAAPRAAVGQDEAIVESLAGILAAEDNRRYAGPLFRAASNHPDPVVRRHAALAMGRIGAPAALPLLLRLTSDPDSFVQRDALFAVGLLGLPRATDRLRDIVLNTPPEEQGVVHAEAVSALTRIGGAESARILGELLNRWVGIAATGRVPEGVARGVGEAWRLGVHAPVQAVAQFVEAFQPEVRWRAVYSLYALNVSSEATLLLRATGDPEPLVRLYAVASLTASFADSAGLDRRGVAARVRRIVDDPAPEVRVEALRALATFGRPEHVAPASDRAADPDPRVRVAALRALGELAGESAVRALSSRVDGGIFATRREAVLGLARAAPDRGLAVALSWTGKESWRERVVAAEALGMIQDARADDGLWAQLADPDARVVLAALRATLRGHLHDVDSLRLVFARHPDAAVRTAAVRGMRRDAGLAGAEVLADAFEMGRASGDDFSSAAVLEALGRMAAHDASVDGWVHRAFALRFPSAASAAEHRAAARWLPRLASRWGAVTPVETGRGIEDYRALAREMVLPAERGLERWELVIETDRGDVTVDLFAADAPFSVQAVLRLVDRRVFDAMSWYRVGPDRAETGDPRGDGWGTIGARVRDEPTAHPGGRGAVGFVSGGDENSGGDRFFIALQPLRAWDGTTTLFGQITSGQEVLDRITLGDPIRRVRRR